MAVEIATAYVSLVPSASGIVAQIKKELGIPLENVVREASAKMGKQLEDGMSKAASGIGRKLATVFAGVQVGSFFKNAITAATDTGEQILKLNVLLGDSAKEVEEWSKGMAKSFGISRQEALKNAGIFSNMFRTSGKTEQDAANMSMMLTELAGDMASFSNTSVQQALDAIGSGLRFEQEPLRKFGVNLDDTTLKQEAFASGLTKTTTGVLPANIRMQAAYNVILKQTAFQQGDSARTADTLAGQTRRLQGEWKDAQAELGQKLLPAMLDLMRVGRDLLPVFGEMVGHFTELVAIAAAGAAPMARFLGGFVASEIGTFAITAVGATYAIDKLADAAKWAKVELLGLLNAAKGHPYMVAIGIAVAAATAAFLHFKREAAESKQRQEDLTKTLIQADNPIATWNQRLATAVEQLQKYKEKLDAANVGTTEFNEAVEVPPQIEQHIEMLNKLGISRADLVDQIKKFDVSEVLRKVEGSIDRRSGPFNLFGRVPTLEENKRLEDFVNLNNDLIKKYQALGQSIKGTFDKAIFNGDVTQEAVNAAYANSKAADETGRWKDVAIELGPQLEKQRDELKKLADEAGITVDEMQPLVDTTKEEEQAHKDAEKAVRDHEKAISDLAKAIDDALDKEFHGEEVQAAWSEFSQGAVKDIEDRLNDATEMETSATETRDTAAKGLKDRNAAVERAQRALGAENLTAEERADREATLREAIEERDAQAATLAKAEEDLKVAKTKAQVIRDTARTLDLNNEFGRENHENMLKIVELGKDEVKNLIESGATQEVVNAKAAEWDQKILDANTAMGFGEEGVKRYGGAVTGALDEVKKLPGAWAEVPREIDLNLKYTATLNSEDFKAKLKEAAATFIDQESAAMVASGIIEIPGADFAFQRPPGWVPPEPRAHGGPVRSGKSYLVGELGPEFFVPDVSGEVISNAELVGVGRGNAGVHIGSVSVVNPVDATADEVVGAIGAKLGWVLTTRNER